MAKENALAAFQKHVRYFLSSDKLAAGLSFMKEHEFGQIVVSTLRGNGEVRLLTTVGIIAWLTSQLGSGGCEANSKIEDVLEYEPAETHQIMGPDQTKEEVQNAFKEAPSTPGLFAVILTDTGLPTGRPVGIATPWDFKLTHSEDYRSVSLRGIQFSLTETEAKVVKVLYEAYLNGTPALGDPLIMEKIGKKSGRLRDSFGVDAWNTLVIPGRRRGTRRLDL